jgi:ubiquinone/menaquinone biosynthesis C-methylase UbiE
MTQDGDTLAATTEVNQAQREHWEHEGARLYRDHTETNEALIGPFGQAMFDAAHLEPGEVVVDVGCGFGTTTLEAEERVAPTGRVVGVDISAAMLEGARQRVAGLDDIELIHADAQTHAFQPGSFDAVISRFGLMFFDDPTAAFGNLARALRPGGRLAFVCPQDPMKSEWVAVAFRAAIAVVGHPPELGHPAAPGAFALADKDRLSHMLVDAGFQDVRLDPVTRPVRLGRDLDSAAEYVLALPEARQLYDGQPTQLVDALRTALTKAFAPYLGSTGVVLDATAWLVTAHR